jgi:hypothetical protein
VSRDEVGSGKERAYVLIELETVLEEKLVKVLERWQGKGEASARSLCGSEDRIK